MKILASRIARELKKAKHCTLYQPELSRVRPDDGRQREPQIASIAKTHGWRLRYYKEGFCAIFDKDPSLKRHQAQFKNAVQLLPPHAQRNAFRRGDAHQQ